MVRKIHHVNFLVRDLEAAIPVYERILGIPVARRDALPDRGVRTARFLVGATWIVLVQPTKPDGVPARHLAEHGEGFFLMSLEVESLETESAAIGSNLIAGVARRGLDDWRIVDLRRDLTFGAQLQLVEDPGSARVGSASSGV